MAHDWPKEVHEQYLGALDERDKYAEHIDNTRSLTLMLHDALAFTGRPLTADQEKDTLELLRFIVTAESVSDEDQREWFKRLLDHGWRTTAEFNVETMRKLMKLAGLPTAELD